MTTDNIPSYLNGVTNVELHYVDPLCNLRVIDVHPERFLGAKTKGKNVDGSSISYVPVENSDIKLVLLPDTGMHLPWDSRTYRVFCDVKGGDGELKDLDTNPRYILQKQIDVAREEDGLEMYSSGEMEGFVFYGLRKGNRLGETPERVTDIPETSRISTIQDRVINKLVEAEEKKSKEEKLKVLKDIMLSPRGRYGKPTPMDGTKHIRQKLYEMIEEKMGGLAGPKKTWEYSHPEVAKEQIEMSLRYAPVMTMNDAILAIRYLTQSYALTDGVVLTYMPKVLTFDNGSGKHEHISLADAVTGRNIFFDKNRPMKLSDEGIYAMNGLLAHFKALVALDAPIPNSNKRLQPHYEAPTNRSWGPKNRTTAGRIPDYVEPGEARIEWRPPDNYASLYLSDALKLAAMRQGIKEKMHNIEPVDFDVWSHSELESIPERPRDLLDELRKDKLSDDVFGPAKDKYIKLRKAEIDLFEKSTGDWDPKVITPYEYENYLVYV